MAKVEQPCNCGDTENCRVCLMRRAHKYRMEGNTKLFESTMAQACRALNKEKGYGSA